MAYCTWQDVNAKMQEIEIDANSNPNITEVTEFINEISADMDAKMQSAGITVPVTDADKLLVLKPIAVNGVKAEVLRSVGQYEDAESLQKLYDAAMNSIINNPAIIEAEEATTTSPGYYIPPSTPVITRLERGVRQW